MSTARQSGNVMLYVLIGIALFGALTFAVTRGSRTPGTLTTGNARINAQSVLTYAEKINGAVQNLMLQNGCLASEISFENTIVSGYTNAASSPRCKVFDLAGGGKNWDTPPAAALDPAAAGASPLLGNYLYSGNVCVDNAGTGPAASCVGDGSGNEDLVLILPWINNEVCDAINQTLGNSSGFFQDTNGSFDGAKFTGTFADGTAIGPTAHQVGCHQSTGGSPGSGYHFYYTLLAR